MGRNQRRPAGRGVKGLRLTRRGEIVKEVLIVLAAAVFTFPVLSLIILTFGGPQ